MKEVLAINQLFPYWKPKPQAKLRMFCFPYAGGSASIFRAWPEHLPVEVDVCSVQLPGRENRMHERPFEQITPLVEALTTVLLPYLDMPSLFFGHSMGALICYELARLLQSKAGISPLHLFASAHRAPHLPDPDPPTYHLPDDEFIAELRRLQGTPEEILRHPEVVHFLLPLVRADFALCETYTYTYASAPPLSCPITVYGALYDSEVSRTELTAWQQHTTKAFKVQFFPGGHFFLHDQQVSLLRLLSKDLSPYLG